MNTLISPDGLIGFGAVLSIVVLAALEYRVTWRRIFGR